MNDLDKIAKKYSEHRGFEKILMDYKILGIDFFCSGETMLDIGCGVGLLTKALACHFIKVVGIDGSLIKIERARKYNSLPHIHYIHKNFNYFTSNEKFDFIVASNVLEHVDEPISFLKKTKRLLESSGHLVITVPNALSLHKRIGIYAGMIDDYYTLTASDIKKGHKRIYDKTTLTHHLQESGYKIEYLTGILLKPLSHQQMVAWDRKIVDALFHIGKDLPDYCSSILAVARHA